MAGGRGQACTLVGLTSRKRAEGRRILVASPRLARGESWLWAPSDGVLERVAFPRIATFDSSQTPQRGEPANLPGALAQLDASAITAPLSGTATNGADEDNRIVSDSDRRLAGMERTLARREQSLTAALAQVAQLEAEAAVMQVRLDRAEQKGGCAAPDGSASR